ncbi:MAG: MoxR family ATPase [Halioglobus sp.]
MEQKLAEQGYIADKTLATTVFLSLSLGKPIFLEGEPGVGKTEIAKTLSTILGSELIRLQCYEGLDTSTALYEWNYTKQMLELRIEEARGTDRDKIGSDIFSEEYLLKRPLLQALQSEGDQPPVLLIDEVDRSDEEFEAFLLEILSDFQITIPELGTIKATKKPVVVLTSNRTRELHDALKRRCLYHWIDYPTPEKEMAIVKARLPNVEDKLAAQICRFIQQIREWDLYKRPGVSETLDWAMALMALNVTDLSPDLVRHTVGCVLKYKGDTEALSEEKISELVGDAKKTAALRAVLPGQYVRK